MPCNSVAVTKARIKGELYRQLRDISTVRDSIRAFFEEHPRLDAERLILPDPSADPPVVGYEYYHRGLMVAVKGDGITIKASGSVAAIRNRQKQDRQGWTAAERQELADGLKATIDDALARAMRDYVRRVAEANGHRVAAVEQDPGEGSYSLVIEVG